MNYNSELIRIEMIRRFRLHFTLLVQCTDNWKRSTEWIKSYIPFAIRIGLRFKRLNSWKLRAGKKIYFWNYTGWTMEHELFLYKSLQLFIHDQDAIMYMIWYCKNIILSILSLYMKYFDKNKIYICYNNFFSSTTNFE